MLWSDNAKSIGFRIDALVGESVSLIPVILNYIKFISTFNLVLLSCQAFHSPADKVELGMSQRTKINLNGMLILNCYYYVLMKITSSIILSA